MAFINSPPMVHKQSYIVAIILIYLRERSGAVDLSHFAPDDHAKLCLINYKPNVPVHAL